MDRRLQKYVVLINFHRFILDASASPSLGSGENRLQTRHYVCQWSFVCRANAPAIGQTQPQNFRGKGSSYSLEWDDVLTAIILDEQTLATFNERVLLLQIIELEPRDVARLGDGEMAKGTVIASGTLDPGVFVRKPPKDYAVKLEHNFVAVGKLFFNLFVENIDSEYFADKTQVVSKLRVTLEKITLDEINPSARRGHDDEQETALSETAHYFFKCKFDGVTYRTPSAQRENKTLVRWNYQLPVDVPEQMHVQQRLRFALYDGDTTVSNFAFDASRLRDVIATKRKGFSVPIRMTLNGQVRGGLFDFSVMKTEVNELKENLLASTGVVLPGPASRPVSASVASTTVGHTSVSPQPQQRTPTTSRPITPDPAPQQRGQGDSANSRLMQQRIQRVVVPNTGTPTESSSMPSRQISTEEFMSREVSGSNFEKPSNSRLSTLQPPSLLARTESPMTSAPLVDFTPTSALSRQSTDAAPKLHSTVSFSEPRAPREVVTSAANDEPRRNSREMPETSNKEDSLPRSSRTSLRRKNAQGEEVSGGEAMASPRVMAKLDEVTAEKNQLDRDLSEMKGRYVQLQDDMRHMRGIAERQTKEIESLRQQNVALLQKLAREEHSNGVENKRREESRNGFAAEHPQELQAASSPKNGSRATAPATNQPPPPRQEAASPPRRSVSNSAPPAPAPFRPSVFHPQPAFPAQPRAPPQTRSGLFFVGDDSDDD